jgi:hypothetical protein
MAQVPDINKVQTGQSQGSAVKPDAQQAKLDQSQKASASQKIQELRGQAGSGPVSSELKSLIEFLESLLGEKAPDGDDHQKLEFLTQRIKEKSPEEQIGILKELSKNFSAKQGSSLEHNVKSLKKEVLATLKEAAKQDKGIANTLINSKESLGQISIDKQSSGIDEIAGSNKFINVQDENLRGVAKKPFEKSLGFLVNFADHQQGFFEDSAFKFSEFAGTSDKSKEAYKVMREADKFWQGEKSFLQELKSAGKSRDNGSELQAALVELATLQVQRGSTFDQDFANIESGKKGGTDHSDLDNSISDVKSKIKTLHSNLA